MMVSKYSDPCWFYSFDLQNYYFSRIYLLLIIQAHYSKLQPEACVEYSCVDGTKALLFYASICFAGLGGGGMRGSAPALGADQFDPKESKHIASFFSWFCV